MPSNNSCPSCSSLIGTTAAVQCDGCKSPMHVSCTDISPEFAARLTRSKSRSVKVYCSPCIAGEDRIQKLSNMLDGFKAYMDDKFAALEAMFNARAACDSPSLENVVSEAMERIKRANNVVIHNLPEPLLANSSTSQPTSDFDRVCELTRQIQGGQNIVPTSVKRVGKEKNGRPRIIIAKFDSPETARKVLRNKDRIKQSRREFSSISITDDKTLAQQDYLQKLRSELKRRTDSGESDLTIKYVKGVPSIITNNSKNQA